MANEPHGSTVMAPWRALSGMTVAEAFISSARPLDSMRFAPPKSCFDREDFHFWY
jgi:hypothetical protein